MTRLLGNMGCITKRVILSGLLIGSLEPCIEDAMIFSANGLSASNYLLMLWIGSIELVGVGQILLLSRFFKNGDRLKAAIVLWVLTIPAVFLFFTLGTLLSSYIRFVRLWSPITILLVATLVAEVPVHVPRTKIPIAYVALILGITIDLTLSLSTGLSSIVLVLPSSHFLSCVVICGAMGAVLLSFSYLSDHVCINRTERAKREIERKLKIVAVSYFLGTAGFLTGYVPSFIPILILGVGFPAVLLTSRKEARIGWFSPSNSLKNLQDMENYEP